MILISIVIVVVLVFGFYLITNTITKTTGFSVSYSEDDEFAACLEEQDITLYINSENSAETLKKIELVDYLGYIKIVNCLRNNQVCLDKGVDPLTWVINGDKINHDISLSELSEFSGCEFN